MIKFFKWLDLRHYCSVIAAHILGIIVLLPDYRSVFTITFIYGIIAALWYRLYLLYKKNN